MTELFVNRVLDNYDTATNIILDSISTNHVSVVPSLNQSKTQRTRNVCVGVLYANYPKIQIDAVSPHTVSYLYWTVIENHWKIRHTISEES